MSAYEPKVVIGQFLSGKVLCFKAKCKRFWVSCIGRHFDVL